MQEVLISLVAIISIFIFSLASALNIFPAVPTLNAKDNQCLLDEMPSLIDKLENKMKDAAKELNFEEAANLRDRIKKLRQKLSRNS